MGIITHGHMHGDVMVLQFEVHPGEATPKRFVVGKRSSVQYEFPWILCISLRCSEKISDVGESRVVGSHYPAHRLRVLRIDPVWSPMGDLIAFSRRAVASTTCTS